MNILVSILSRSRPNALSALIYTLDQLARFPENITFAFRADEDDIESTDSIYRLQRSGNYNIILGSGPRHPGLGQIWNDTFTLATRIKPSWDCLCIMSDGTVPLTRYWDLVIIDYFQRTKAAACAWQELNDPTNITYPVLTRKWYDAVSPDIMPTVFPYWYCDTHLAEVHELAFGRPMAVLPELPLAGRRGTTNGLREVRFWQDVFTATRPDRVAQAAKLTAAFGRQPPDPEPILALLRQRDLYQNSRAALYEQYYGAEHGAPSQRYLAAKTSAEAILGSIYQNA